MPISAEAIRGITGFHTEIPSQSERVDLGEVTNSKGEPIKVVYGKYAYQQRHTGDAAEPLLSGRWTTQPTVALVTREGSYPLPYGTVIRRLPDRLVEQVAGVVSAARNIKS